MNFDVPFLSILTFLCNAGLLNTVRDVLRCDYTKFHLKILIVFRYVLIFQEYPVVCRFYYRNDRERNGTFTEMCEAL